MLQKQCISRTSTALETSALGGEKCNDASQVSYLFFSFIGVTVTSLFFTRWYLCSLFFCTARLDPSSLYQVPQELSGHFLGYSVQTANSFEVVSVTGGGEHVLNCREVQDLQARGLALISQGRGREHMYHSLITTAGYVSGTAVDGNPMAPCN